MDKEDLKELADNPQFIKSIYNYCDRWCERCPFTSRCLNFALGSEQFSDQEAHDINNEAFWHKLTETLRITHELLEELAEREGIDLDSIDIDEFSETERLTDELISNHECCRLAKLYGEMVDDWLDSAREFSEQQADKMNSASELSTERASPFEEHTDITEAINVVRWYQYQIYVKIMRAVRGDYEERSEILDEFPKDSDGSAKVALIGIDRSIAAWGELRNRFPLHNNDILHILLKLEKLRRRVEKVFPNARAFIRPGFDKVDLNS